MKPFPILLDCLCKAKANGVLPDYENDWAEQNSFSHLSNLGNIEFHLRVEYAFRVRFSGA